MKELFLISLKKRTIREKRRRNGYNKRTKIEQGKAWVEENQQENGRHTRHTRLPRGHARNRGRHKNPLEGRPRQVSKAFVPEG